MKSISEHEENVRQLIKPDIVEYLTLMQRLGDAIGIALDATLAHPPLALSGMIQVLQIARLQGDLRVLHWMVEHGYAMAAASHTATIYELAFRTLYLRNSEERATAWMNHEKSSKSYPSSLHEAIHDFFRQVPDAEPWVADRAYNVYSELCWAKHGNPILQREYGTTLEGNESVIHQIPYVDGATVGICRHASVHATRTLRWLVLWFYNWHLGVKALGAAERELEAINQELDRIAIRDGLLKQGPPSDPGAAA